MPAARTTQISERPNGKWYSTDLRHSQIGEEGLSWDGCDATETSSVVTDVVIYGMTRMPSSVTVDADGTTVEPSDDPFSNSTTAFYDSNVMRLQVSDLSLDWCDEAERRISWTFTTESWKAAVDNQKIVLEKSELNKRKYMKYDKLKLVWMWITHIQLADN